MRNLSKIVIGALAALLLSTATFADVTRKVEGWTEDSTKPGLKQPKTFDLDDRAGNLIYTSANVGTKNGATVTAVEYGTPNVHTTVLTLATTPITLTDEAEAGQYGGVKLYDFPAGNIAVLGAVFDGDLTLDDTEWLDTAEGDIGFGTTAVTDGNALATTEQNIIQTTAIAALTAQVGPANAQTGSAGVLHTATAGGTDADLYVNVRIDDNAAHVTGTGSLTGTLTITWVYLGDF